MTGTKWTQAGRGETLARLASAVVVAAAMRERLAEAAQDTVGVIEKAARRLAGGMQARTSVKLTGAPVSGFDIARIHAAVEDETGQPAPRLTRSDILVWRPEGGAR